MITFNQIETMVNNSNGNIKKIVITKDAMKALLTDAVTGESSEDTSRRIVYTTENFGNIEIESVE